VVVKKPLLKKVSKKIMPCVRGNSSAPLSLSMPVNFHAHKLTLWWLTLCCVVCSQETAINIGFACSLITDDMTQARISASQPHVEQLEEAGKKREAEEAADETVQVWCPSVVTIPA
jgi:hypothetical protein